MQMTKPAPRCFAEIDPAALRHNALVAAELAGPRCGIYAVIKADAYGHGAITAARALHGVVRGFAVADTEEANSLRIAGMGEPILVLSPLLPGEAVRALTDDCIVTASSADAVRKLAADAPGIRINLKIDTGMGRQGVPETEAMAVARAVRETANAKIEMVSTHLPSADCDPAFTEGQLKRFAELAAALRPLLPGVEFHCLNSAGLMRFPQFAMDAVRPGLMLYGVAPVEEHAGRLKPALAWKTRVCLVREVPPGTSVSYGRSFVTRQPTRLATLAAGYADGYPRALSRGGAEVLIRGFRCPVVGAVTMDQIVVDASAVPGNPQPGQEVVLLGADGDENISASELAAKAGTIPWEILTGISKRTVRMAEQ